MSLDQNVNKLQALFVHGMGRTPFSGGLLLLRLHQHGLQTHSFSYFVALERFTTIRDRLVQQICVIAAKGDYVLIGHSLGGVLLRSAIARLPPECRKPKRLFLLGSPIKASRIARRLQYFPPYRIATGDCGQMLANEQRMANIESVDIPTVAILGIKGIKGVHSPFADEDNDSIVAASETDAAWVETKIQLPVRHTFMPSDRVVSNAIIANLKNI